MCCHLLLPGGSTCKPPQPRPCSIENEPKSVCALDSESVQRDRATKIRQRQNLPDGGGRVAVLVDAFRSVTLVPGRTLQDDARLGSGQVALFVQGGERSGWQTDPRLENRHQRLKDVVRGANKTGDGLDAVVDRLRVGALANLRVCERVVLGD